MKPTSFITELLRLEFNATAIANVADNAAAAPLTQLHVALHSSFPGYAGTQATSEVFYTGYARQPVARSVAGFTVAGRQVTFVANVAFPERTDNGAVVEAAFFTIGRQASGAGAIQRIGVLGAKMGVITGASTDAVSVPGHTLAVNDRCTFVAVDAQALPTGITEGALYYVKTVAGNDITLSLTAGGATVDITAAGGGVLYKSTPVLISQFSSPILRNTSLITEG